MANEKEFMSPKELRQKLKLKAGFGKYGVADIHSDISEVSAKSDWKQLWENKRIWKELII